MERSKNWASILAAIALIILLFCVAGCGDNPASNDNNLSSVNNVTPVASAASTQDTNDASVRTFGDVNGPPDFILSDAVLHSIAETWANDPGSYRRKYDGHVVETIGTVASVLPTGIDQGVIIFIKVDGATWSSTACYFDTTPSYVVARDFIGSSMEIQGVWDAKSEPEDFQDMGNNIIIGPTLRHCRSVGGHD